MQVADKNTLDLVKSITDRIGTYIGYKKSNSTMRYYLPSSIKIICDKDKISISQDSGTPTEVSEGYEITQIGYVEIISLVGNIDESVYVFN